MMNIKYVIDKNTVKKILVHTEEELRGRNKEDLIKIIVNMQKMLGRKMDR